MGAPITPTPAMLREIRAALGQLGPLTARPPGQSWQAQWREFAATAARIEAGAEARYRERVRQWQRNAPMREAAERAMRAAHARRAAELGESRGGRMPVLNALWAAEPERVRMW